MKVNFNNLRAQAAYALDRLTKTLNESVEEETIYHHRNDSSWITGDMILDAEDIQKDMDDLRSLILTINSVFEEGNEEFKSMLDHIESTGGLAHFNHQEES